MAKKDKNNFERAKLKADNEFYTQYQDIADEVMLYRRHLEGRVVYCNCDSPDDSMFFKFFHDHFFDLKLKRLIATHLVRQDLFNFTPNYITEFDGSEITKTPLQSNGDYASTECLNLLDRADVVITNPPFSIFREFLTTLLKHNKKVLVVGHMCISQSDAIHPLLYRREIWTGAHELRNFLTPSGEVKGVQCFWYTNLDSGRVPIAYKSGHNYNPQVNKPYDNLPEIIECPSIRLIPDDYDGLMGVPVNFLSRINHDQFEYLGHNKIHVPKGALKQVILDGKILYSRWILKRRPEFIGVDEYNSINKHRLIKFGKELKEQQEIEL